MNAPGRNKPKTMTAEEINALAKTLGPELRPVSPPRGRRRRPLDGQLELDTGGSRRPWQGYDPQ
jgi:hypothetical protein